MYVLPIAFLLATAASVLHAMALPSASPERWSSGGPATSLELDANSLERLRRRRASSSFNRQNATAAQLRTGLGYTKFLLLSGTDSAKRYPYLYPDVTAVPATGDVSSVRKIQKLIEALDKVLGLYDFYDEHLNNSKSRGPDGEELDRGLSVEEEVLREVMDTLVNQTCDWIRSLGVKYHNGDETFVCTRPQLKKLHALSSAYLLIYNIHFDFKTFIKGNRVSVTEADWLKCSGLNTRLRSIVNGTSYGSPLNNILNQGSPPNCI